MRHYSEECKATIIARMLPPHNVNVAELARETGIPKDTLYTWRIKNRQSPPTDASENVMAEGLNSADKFDIVIETATMNEAELSAYCRRKGLYPEQITGWKKLCLNANQPLPKKVPTIVRRQAKENKALKAELRRKDKALAETAALLVLKKSPADLGGPRGQLITFQDKQKVIELIDEACAGGARLSAACELLGVSPRTMQRWRQQGKPDRRKAAARQRTPGNKLSEQERDQILRICNQPEFAIMSPNQIVPALADQGIYVASEASFYRVLRNANQLGIFGDVH